MPAEHLSPSSSPGADARRIFDKAAKLLQAENFVAAEQLLIESLETLPNDPNLLRLLGVSLAKQRRFADAEKRLTHVVRLIPEHSRAYEDVADVQLAQRKLEEALASLRSAIRHAPDPARVQQRLAELLSIMGRSSESEAAFEGVLDSDPVRKELAQAMELANAGRLNEAELVYAKLLRHDPENVDALRLFGILQVKRERYDDASAYFRRAVELAPDFWKAWINLGTAHSELQRFEEAESAYQSALALQPRSVHVLERLGANAMKAGDLTRSVDWLERSLAISSEHFPSLLCLGHALKTLGRQEEAVEAYRRCLRVKPEFGEAYWSLANLKTFGFSDDDVAAMHEQLALVADSSDDEQSDAEIAFSFALGKAYEDRKDYRKAFDHYSRGNAKKRFKVNYDPIEFQDNNDRIIEVFSQNFFEEREGWGCQDESPILVVGLPRSGSTLLEQILASHSQVEGTAELHYLLRGATQSGLNRTDGIRYPQVMHELQLHHVRGLGEEYIESTLQHRSGSPRFTDKMPNNFSAIGFLHTILPKAKVVDARRHPLDSCLGTFKQLFANGQVFSYDLYDLAHYYGQYVRLMNHWAEVLPGKVHTVHYEDVVDDLEREARSLSQYCGLPWESSMLEFHSNTRAVKTASSEQVRQPIYRSSVSLWRRYEDQLGELIEYLEPVLACLPERDRPAVLV